VPSRSIRVRVRPHGSLLLGYLQGGLLLPGGLSQAEFCTVQGANGILSYRVVSTIARPLRVQCCSGLQRCERFCGDMSRGIVLCRWSELLVPGGQLHIVPGSHELQSLFFGILLSAGVHYTRAVSLCRRLLWGPGGEGLFLCRTLRCRILLPSWQYIVYTEPVWRRALLLSDRKCNTAHCPRGLLQHRWFREHPDFDFQMCFWQVCRHPASRSHTQQCMPWICVRNWK